MEYKIMIDKFEGPMDLLLHLIKTNDIDIFDIRIDLITKQYLDYLHTMEELDLDIASEYLTMAAELIEIKSSMLLPKPELEEDEYVEDPREKLIERLLEYKRYKEVVGNFRDLEEERKNYYTKEMSDLREYSNEDMEVNIGDVTLESLTEAFRRFLERKKEEQPLHTKITKKEYSVTIRSKQIKSLLREKKRIDFEELFEEYTKEYMVVTFLSVLDLAKKQELKIKQEKNFEKIILVTREGE